MDRFQGQGNEARRNAGRPDLLAAHEEFIAGHGEATFDPRGVPRIHDPRRGGSYSASYSVAHRLQRDAGPLVGGALTVASRSDEQVREALRLALAASPDIDAHAIEVTVDQGQVTLEGTVPVRAMKRATEDIAAGISGVQDIRNALRVRRYVERRLVP